MKVKDKIVRFFRGLNKNVPLIEVWDTSAVIKCLNEFQKSVDSEDNIKIVVTEGVFHELSVGRHKYEKARNAYKYILNNKSEKLITVSTEDKIRAWTIDEQVVYVAVGYRKKGYDITLVTCDRDQAFKAELQGVKTRWIDINLVGKKESYRKESTKVVFSSEGNDTFGKVGEEMKLAYTMQGKEMYVPLKRGMSVLDHRGRRKIGKDERVKIERTDTVRYYGVNYRIETIANSEIVFKKDKAN